MRILEFGAGAAGPIATRFFAEHGATVLRVESATRPDFLRAGHYADMFDALNCGKRSVTLNLKHPDGHALAKRLVTEWADAVEENFAPRAMRSLGFAERPYIEHNIRMTREAYLLDRVAEKDFAAQENITATALERNSLTIKNIRLWDHRPLLVTYGKLQEIRVEIRVKATSTVPSGLEEEITAWAGQVLGEAELPAGSRTIDLAGELPARDLPTIELPHGRTDATVHLILARAWKRDPHVVRDVAICSTTEI